MRILLHTGRLGLWLRRQLGHFKCWIKGGHLWEDLTYEAPEMDNPVYVMCRRCFRCHWRTSTDYRIVEPLQINVSEMEVTE